MDAINKFHVYDQEYELRVTSESAAARLTMVTEMVDLRMKEIASQYVNQSVKNIAVLAALNLADDYIEMQERSLPAQSCTAEIYAEYDTCIPAYIEKIESFLDRKES